MHRRAFGAFVALGCLAWTAPAVRAEDAPPQLPETVTFSEHIAPIVFTQCTYCHRPGEAAPFSLMSYKDVRKHARTIVRAVSSRYMPPWQPEPGCGEFLGSRRLTDEQIGLIKKWASTGIAEGDPKKLPKLPEFTAGWQVGKPDLIVSMDRDFEVPEDGPDLYQNFVLPLNLPEDKWVSAIEFRASEPTVVHHVLYFLDNSGRASKRDAEESKPGKPGFPGMGFRPTGMLGGWAVGDIPRKLPAGLARPLVKGSDLVLQTHFHPTGKAEKCRLTVALYFADKPPSRHLIPGFQLPPRFGVFSGLDIPPGKADYTVRDSFTLPIDIDLVGVAPHAHYIGKSLKLTAELPGKPPQTLFWIKDWDFNWQGTYYYKDFIRLPKGTVLNAEVVWDNSADNPRNPSSPPVRVKWGEGSTDEMGTLPLLLLPANEADAPTMQKAVQAHVRAALRTAILRGDKLPVEMFQEKGNPKLTRAGPVPAEQAPAFQDVTGKPQHPLQVGSDKAHVLFFITHDCPISNGYAPEVAAIVKEYADKGVRCYAVHVDSDFTAEAARKHAAEYNLPCPVLLDPKHQLVKAAGVTITPEVAVLTPDGKVAYRGRIDDQYPGLGKKRVAPAERDLRNALNDILAGKPVKTARTEAVGCSIPDLP